MHTRLGGWHAERKARTAIISVDGHVKAPRAGYRDFVESKYLERYDEWVKAAEGFPDGFVRAEIGEASQWDAKQRLADLETQGVVGEVLFSNGAPFDGGRAEHAPDPELNRAGNMAYNRWLVEFCSHAPDQLFGQALLSFDDVGQAVTDVYWAKENGLRGILMPALYPGGTFFFDPVLDPIWAACQEVGLPLSQHGGLGSPAYNPPGFAAILVLATEQAFFSGRSMWQMILGGAFERFPDLKLAFIETQAWWITAYMEQLDKRMAMGDDWTAFAGSLGRQKAFTRKASEYWQTNCYAGVSPFHPSQLPIDELGSEGHDDATGFHITSANAMFGVDYPHFESIYPATMDQVTGLVTNPHVTEADASKILFDNAAELFHFDVAALQPHVDRVGFDLEVVAGFAGRRSS